MENLAYLYLVDAYEASAEKQLGDRAIAQWFEGLNWRRLSSASYIRFVSLGAILSVLSLTSHAWALSRGDLGDDVSSLQQNLRSLGCFNGLITGLYDRTTETGVRRCQEALGLPSNGVADLTTQQMFDRRLGQLRTQQFMPAPTEPRLALGDRGDEVRFVQQTLLDLGYFDASVTEFYGNITEQAVRNFQAANQLPVSGQIDAATYGLLQERSVSSPVAVSSPVGDRGLSTVTSFPSQGSIAVARSQGLQLGDRGTQVRTLQKRLIVWGYSNVNVDSIYNAETEAAVKQFQIGYGFIPDGIADANTQKVLNQKLYVVVIPKRNNRTLSKVQQIFTTAFEASSRLGTYVHAGSYSNYDVAKTRVKFLKERGIDARVAYF